MKIHILMEIYILWFLRDFLTFGTPWGEPRRARKRSPRYERGTIINNCNAIPPLAFRTLSHHVHCQRYLTTTLAALSHSPNAIAPATLSTLSRHPQCQRSPTSHITNTIPSPAMLDLLHPHCRIPCPRIHIAKLTKWMSSNSSISEAP